MLPRRIGSFLVLVLALTVAGCTQQSVDSSAPEPRPVAESERQVDLSDVNLIDATETFTPPASQPPDIEWVLDLKPFNDTVSLKARFGEPTSIELPAEDDPSPWGQWFRWDLPDGSRLTALAGVYDWEHPAGDAPVNVIMLSSFSGASVPTINGFTLAQTTKGGVVESLGASLQESVLADRREIDPEARHASALRVLVDGWYTFYMFDDQDRLISVIQSDINMDAAD